MENSLEHRPVRPQSGIRRLQELVENNRFVVRGISHARSDLPPVFRARFEGERAIESAKTVRNHGIGSRKVLEIGFSDGSRMQLDQNLDQVEFEGDTLRIRIRRAHPHMPNSFLEIDAPGAFAEYVYRFEMHPKIALAEIVVAGGAAEPKTVVAGTGFRP